MVFSRIEITIQILLLAALYFLAAKLSLYMNAVGGVAAPVWPPTGIALAAILLGGIRLWPAIAIGAFLVNFSVGVPLLGALGIALGNTLESVIAFLLLTHLVRFDPRLKRIRDVIALIIVAALFCTLIAASIGTTSSWLAGMVSSTDYSKAWWAWWIGDMGGVLIVTPFILTWISKPEAPKNVARFLEACLLLFCLALMGQFIFGSLTADFPRYTRQVYVLFPLLLWAAFRFGQKGVTLVVVTMSTVAIWFTLQGQGPFRRQDLTDSLILLAVFMTVYSLTGLLLAAALAERENAETKLMKANEELTRLNQMKSEFSSLISHELRTPLGCIRDGIDLVMDGTEGPISMGQKETLGIAQSNVHRLGRFVNNILDYSSADLGRIRMNSSVHELMGLIAEVRNFMGLEAQRRGIRLTVDFPETSILLLCDGDKIRQVLINLIHNALKFTSKGGEVIVRLRSLEKEAVIEVEDTGQGMEAQEQKRLLDLFSEMSPDSLLKAGETGVGLAVCKLVTHLHGGCIRVASKLGEGTRFVIHLPFSSAPPPSQG